MDHAVSRALEAGNDAFAVLLNRPATTFENSLVEEGWPPGHPGPEFYHIAGVPETPVEDASQTPIGQMLAAKGIKI